MNELYPFENFIKFIESNRTIHIDTKSASEAQEVKKNLEDADYSAKRWAHKRPASVNYIKRPESVKYNVSINDSAIDISGNDLSDIVAAVNDIFSLSYITKAKRDSVMIHIDKAEDTPERRAKIKAEFIATIKARQKQQQQKMSVGNGSHLLMPPKSNLPAVPASTNGHQNGNTQISIQKPGGK